MYNTQNPCTMYIGAHKLGLLYNIYMACVISIFHKQLAGSYHTWKSKYNQKVQVHATTGDNNDTSIT